MPRDEGSNEMGQAGSWGSGAGLKKSTKGFWGQCKCSLSRLCCCFYRWVCVSKIQIIHLNMHSLLYGFINTISYEPWALSLSYPRSVCLRVILASGFTFPALGGVFMLPGFSLSRMLLLLPLPLVRSRVLVFLYVLVTFWCCNHHLLLKRAFSFFFLGLQRRDKGLCPYYWCHASELKTRGDRSCCSQVLSPLLH